MAKFKFTHEPDYEDLRYLRKKGEWPDGVPDWAQELADYLDTYPGHPVVFQMALEHIVERQIGEMRLATEHSNTMTKRVSELSKELERVQRLPSLDWAEACAAFTQHLATLARSGKQPAAKKAMKALDGLKVYVTGLEATLRDVRAELEIVRKQLGNADRHRETIEDDRNSTTEELLQIRGQLEDVLADRHNFRVGLRHVQTELSTVMAALSSIDSIVAKTLDDERGLPRGFEHEPDGQGMQPILAGEKP